jgi:glucose-6-phosphate dehydrogenase assembly protein OpcA
MIALWDSTGNDVVRALSSERRNAGGVASGCALTLVVSVDERHVQRAEEAAATAAAQHPCRLIIVVRSNQPAHSTRSPESRLDAEIVVGGRLGPAEAVVLRMHGRLARHAESIVIPLLAPDVPTVTWWYSDPPSGSPPTRSACSPSAGSPTWRVPPTRSRRCTSGPRTTPRATPT